MARTDASWEKQDVFPVAVDVGGNVLIEMKEYLSQLKCDYTSTNDNWAASRENQQNDLNPQGRLRSAWAYAQSDQFSLSSWRNIGSLSTHWAHSEDWSDWADAQADLSLRWAHRSFCWFSRDGARMGITLEKVNEALVKCVNKVSRLSKEVKCHRKAKFTV